MGLLSAVCFGFFNIASADTTIRLSIETASGSLYDQEINVAPCDSDNAGTMSITAYCAVLQSGVANNWSWYGTDAFLNSLGGAANDFTNNIYWGWFHDLVYGDTAMSAYTLSSGENILLNFDINPLKLTVSDSNPSEHSTVVLTLSEFSLDESFNPIWNPAVGGSVDINGTVYPVENDGTYSLTLNSTDPFVISGTKTGFINSVVLTLNPTRAVGGGGGKVSPYTPSSVEVEKEKAIEIEKEKVPEVEKIVGFDTKKAFDFLISQQKENGSFGQDLYTDWIALALASMENQNQKIQSVISLVRYFGELKIADMSLTNLERHTMALLALGLNPYSTNGENYIQKIADAFDGKQFGDVNEDNDDIFALIVLSNAGYSKDEDIIKNTIAYILSRQGENGSWDESVDMTGAGIQALSIFHQDEQIKNALAKAKEFLKQNQKEDGGWGNASSTAWAIGGILALTEKPEDWIKKSADNLIENTPLDFLTKNQDTDGGIKNEAMQNKIWETAYALSALSGKPWNQIMQKFDKPELPKIVEIQAKKEVVKKQEVKKQEVKKSRNLTVVQNVATPIAAIADISVKEKTPEPAKNKNWFVRFWESVLGF